MTRTALLFLLATLLGVQAHAQQPAVPTDQGPVRGQQRGEVRRFLGLPYAAPPVGHLRWKAPQPGPTWTVPREATTFGPVCTQVVVGLFDVPGETKGDVKGSEDCLYLNVYAPAQSTSAARLPVMVWIHGGGFTIGAGSEYDPSVLVQKHGVVVVTLNYRLGALGFLAHPGLDAESAEGTSGNYGLLDQQAALRWVGRNIAAFGGNPGNVTLFGESAGGMSVCAHLASPASAGLFQKAIIQSGLCASPNNTVTAAQASRRNVAYAARLGCRTGGVACLRGLDARTAATTAVPGLRGLGNLVWSPVYGTSLLPRTLGEAFDTGAFNRVPVMVGSNHDEGRLFISLAAPAGKPIQLWQYWGASGLLVGAAKNGRVLAEYPGRSFSTPALAFATVFTDAMFSCPALRVSRSLSRYVRTYAYEFNDPQAVTTLKAPADLPGLGAFHSSGLVYAFQTPIVGLGDPAQFSAQQRRLSDEFSASWVRFAGTGDPNPTGRTPWTPFDASRGNVWIFRPTGSSESTTFGQDHRCDFWSGLGLN